MKKGRRKTIFLSPGSSVERGSDGKLAHSHCSVIQAQGQALMRKRNGGDTVNPPIAGTLLWGSTGQEGQHSICRCRTEKGVIGQHARGEKRVHGLFFHLRGYLPADWSVTYNWLKLGRRKLRVRLGLV